MGSRDYLLHGCPVGLSQCPECGHHSVLQGSQVVCRSSKCGLRIEDHFDRYGFKELGEAPFILKGADEVAVFEFREDLRGDASPDVDPGSRQGLEREIAGLSAVDGHKKLE